MKELKGEYMLAIKREIKNCRAATDEEEKAYRQGRIDGMVDMLGHFELNLTEYHELMLWVNKQLNA